MHLLLLSLLSLLAGPAAAQDAPEMPLAIPAGPSTAPATPATPAPLPPSSRPGAMSPQKLDALRRYKAERLEIQGETEVHQGAATVWTGVRWGPRWGPRRGPGRGPHTAVAVVATPSYATHGWGIYQGPERLQVPDALQLAGDPRGDQLQQTVARKHRTANAWYTVAGLGGGAIIAGIFGQISAPNRHAAYTWQLVSVGGAGAAAVGVLAGGSAAADARSLAQYPARTLTVAEARQVVDQHNDHLRQELGLSPQDVWEIERGQPGAR